MKIVIDIPENVYKEIYSDAEIIIYSGMRSGKTLLSTLLRAIRKGIPIPKGHGRLIDESKITSCEWNGYLNYMATNAPTIIEADKAESEDKE